MVDPIGAVESVKAASDIYAPVSGVITEINETLNERANLLNKDSEGAGKYSDTRRDSFEACTEVLMAKRDAMNMTGWLCKIKLSAPSEFDSLLNEQAYKAHCEGESS